MIHHFTSCKRKLITFILFICVLALAGCGAKKDNTKSLVVPNVAVKSMCLTSVALYAYSNANISVKSSLNITPETTAKILKILCRNGETVKQGQVLYQLNDQGNSENALQQAKLTQSSAKKTYDNNLKLGTNIAPAELRQSKIAYETAKLATAQAQIAVDNLTIRAPFAGTVHQQDSAIKVGVPVTPSDKLAQLVNPNNYEINYSLGEDWTNQAKVGQAVSIYHNGKLISSGTTYSVDKSIDPSTGTFAVVTYIDASPNLIVGEDVAVKQTVGKKDNVFLIPSVSLQTGTGGFSVLVVDKQHVSIKKIKVMLEHVGDSTVVLDGLKAGDLVVTQGMSLLHDGDKVKVDASKSLMECS